MAFRMIILCFCFLFISHSFSSSLNPPSCNPHDSSTLLHFTNSFSLNHHASYGCDDEFYDEFLQTIQYKNSSYPKTASWANDSNCCLWDGVTCDSMSGHVIGLNLSCSWLQGQLHSNSTLFQLSHLQTLNLAFNDFNGSLLSSKFGDLSTLMHLNLSSSSFVGEVPPKIAELSKLVSLDLSQNYIFSSESWMALRLEPFTWERLILNMTNLRELILDFVNMSSSAQSFLSLPTNFSSSLAYLSLSDTLLQGNLDHNIFHLQNLQKLDLSWNENLRGQLLNSIGHLKSLKFLSLEQCHLDGPIPRSFENITQLTFLNLRENNFRGELSFLSNLQSLTSLDLSYNNFGGGLSSLSNLQSLTSLDLSYNNFSGGLSSFSNLQSIEILYLSNNKFLSLTSNNNLNYTIPNLESLSLSSCNVTSFPKFLDLPKLQFLDLSGNKLQSLPESISSFMNLSSLYLSSNNLRGSISLHQFSKLQNLGVLDLSNNTFLSLSPDPNVHYTIPNLKILYLSSCNINDFPNLLGNLPNLKELDLSNNKIPKWFNNVRNGSLKYLDLSHNNLTSIEHLSMRNLTFLDLSFNLLEGILPIPSFGVKFFSVSNNKLSGDIPSSFCNASSLVVLNLSHNNLSGYIPKCLVAFPALTTLDLQMNNFVGTIPNNFSKSSSLMSLHLNNNQLIGRLPLSLVHCKQLDILDAGGNMINDEFPNWLESLPKLQVLTLRNNKFYGVVHSSNTKHPFPMLRIFDVSNNHFKGPLPTAYIRGFKEMMKVDYASSSLDYIKSNYSYQESVMVTLKGIDLELVRIITTFTIIDLSNNSFDGEIPQVIGHLHSLKGLNLSHNKITGPIPHSIANLTNLESLDLSSNRLTGEIPLALENLNFLEVLNLSQNQLVGEIPRGKQFGTFLNDSYEGNLGLCGFPLSKACNQVEAILPQPTSSTNDKFEFGWKPVAMGYGCGMVFGMFMGQVVFFTGKPEWLVRIFQARPKKEAKRGRRKITHPNQRRVN